jgi:hypothetical protein|tara:strand:- start:13 stop:246 length:234 start_codon:yes stop_codon:yes gene_type:complete
MKYMFFVSLQKLGGFMQKQNDLSRKGIVSCLGWCNKTFNSPDKVTIRFCPKCRDKKDNEMSKSGMTSRKCSLDIPND